MSLSIKPKAMVAVVTVEETAVTAAAAAAAAAAAEGATVSSQRTKHNRFIYHSVGFDPTH